MHDDDYDEVSLSENGGPLARTGERRWLLLSWRSEHPERFAPGSDARTAADENGRDVDGCRSVALDLGSASYPILSRWRKYSSRVIPAVLRFARMTKTGTSL